jgi:hypothetical protein
LCRDRIGLRARRKKFKFSRILGNEKASRERKELRKPGRKEEDLKEFIFASFVSWRRTKLG